MNSSPSSMRILSPGISQNFSKFSISVQPFSTKLAAAILELSLVVDSADRLPFQVNDTQGLTVTTPETKRIKTKPSRERK